jgi:formylglycine-generating enzyme required for sulfatase activity
MHGNVSEWCWDSFGEYASGAQTDPMGASGSYQVFRGGSWENYGLELRSAYRNYLSPGDMGKWFGFRLVRPIASSGGGAVPAITTASLPDGAVGTAYSRTLAARGDTPIIWSLESGTLPAGLNLAGTTGVISGTPTTAGTSHFTVKATNATGSDTKPLSITITAVGGGVAPAITTAALLDGTEGVAYNQTLAATGDTPITWTIGSGTLPTGLNLAGTTGVISGTPTTVGTSNFTVRAANAAGIGTKPFSITIGEQKPPIEGMVWIEPGTFTMGSPTSEPNHNVNETQHEVTLTKGFYMSKYPVTQAQYEEVMRTNPSHFIDPVAPETSTANRPVECVNWYDAIVFCNKLSMNKGLTPAYSISGSTDPAVWGEVPRIGSNPTWNAVIIVADSNGYRLPTEAQWEYACRAGTTTPFNTGNNITTDQANYDGNYPYNNNPNGEYRNRTTEVGSFAPNTWDLYDMHGNVFEFCWDWFNSTYYASSPAQDPTGPDSGSYRVIRGGSYYNSAGESRSAYRGPSNGPYYGGWYNGFRLVLPAQ